MHELSLSPMLMYDCLVISIPHVNVQLHTVVDSRPWDRRVCIYISSSSNKTVRQWKSRGDVSGKSSVLAVSKELAL